MFTTFLSQICSQPEPHASGDTEDFLHPPPTADMYPSDGKEPPRRELDTVSLSPAYTALKGNLSAADGEPSQQLKKRKSWMASLRDVVQRGALQAKSAVDVFRGDQTKAEA